MTINDADSLERLQPFGLEFLTEVGVAKQGNAADSCCRTFDCTMSEPGMDDGASDFYCNGSDMCVE